MTTWSDLSRPLPLRPAGDHDFSVRLDRDRARDVVVAKEVDQHRPAVAKGRVQRDRGVVRRLADDPADAEIGRSDKGVVAEVAVVIQLERARGDHDLPVRLDRRPLALHVAVGVDVGRKSRRRGPVGRRCRRARRSH
jgi:hypothetical protein